MRSVFRYEVPIDDQDHEIELTQYPMEVATVIPNLPGIIPGGPIPYMEFWAEHNDKIAPFKESFRVFGTGQPIPENYAYVGTGQRVNGMVFHLYRKQNELGF